MDAARAAGTSEGLLDRLLLTPVRIEGMAAGLEKLADLPDPVARVSMSAISTRASTCAV